MGLLLLAGAVLAASSKTKTEIQQEISIKAEGTGGPAVQVPGPKADKETVDEVVRSLDLYKSEHKDAVPVTVGGVSKRLSRPFPESPFLVFSPQSVAAPYDSWVFEIVSGGEVIWRTEGVGPVREPIEWDGSGSAGNTVVRVEQPYRFRFTGRSGPGEFAVESPPVSLKSLSYQEFLGERRLEIANSVLFKKGQGAFAAGSDEYLDALADRLRRADVKGEEPYKFIVYDAAPKGERAKSRADKLRRYFAKLLLITPKRVQVDILKPGARGDATVCVLPAEKGAVIRNE